MMLALSICFTIFFVVTSILGLEHQYELELQRIVLVNGTDFIKFKGLRVKRFNKTIFSLKGEVNVLQDFDGEWDVQMDVWRSKLGNNQWELTPLKVARQTACKFMENVYIPKMQEDLKDSSTFPYIKEGEETCPFKGGEYEITDHLLNVQSLPAFMQDGTYRIETWFWKEDVIKTGYYMFVKIEPKIS